MLKRVGWILICCANLLFCRDFVIGDANLLTPPTHRSINLVGSELFDKTGISAYVVIKNSILDSVESKSNKSSREQREKFIHEVIKSLSPPFFVFFFIKEDKKIDFRTSPDLQDALDYEVIYKNHIVPLLPIDRSDVLNSQRISAIVLNGFIYFCDAIAKTKGERVADFFLDRSGDLIAKTARVVMLILLLSLLGLYIWRLLRR